MSDWIHVGLPVARVTAYIDALPRGRLSADAPAPCPVCGTPPNSVTCDQFARVQVRPCMHAIEPLHSFTKAWT